MRVCIYRGTHQIGGTCVEIESGGERLILDVGLPLDANRDEASSSPFPGSGDPDPSLVGLVISHPHLDHYGLARKVSPGTPVLIGAAARKILDAASIFLPDGITFSNTIDLVDRRPIKRGRFTITPFLMDHSAYDAYAILVEADGKRLFYSGDFRGHGRKGVLLDRLVDNPPKDIDVLLMEGSTLGRIGVTDAYPTESDLEERFCALFRSTNGMPLVWCSGQNIDRLVTVFRACKRTKRQLIMDMYTAAVLRAIGNPHLPQPGWPEVRVYLPRSQKETIISKKLFPFAKSFAQSRIYPEQLCLAAGKSVMLFRPSMGNELERANCLQDALLIYSMWSGYLEDKRYQWFLKWLKGKGIPLVQCHTSGHAPVGDLKRLAGALAPRMLVPIHSFEPERYSELFENVHRMNDGEWLDVTSDICCEPYESNRALGDHLVPETQGFRRWLDPELVETLNRLERDKRSWWHALVHRPGRDVFIAVRVGYLSVYTGGGEFLKIGWAEGGLKLETHEEYLLLRSRPPYVQLGGKAHRFKVIETPEQLVDEFRWVQQRIKTFSGAERIGVASIAARIENVIDIEVTARHACNESPLSTEPETRRGSIDLAAVDPKGVLRFFEAKLLSNKELRSSTGAPEVIGQLRQYQNWVEKNQSTVREAFEDVLKLYRTLAGEFFRKRIECVPSIINVQCAPTLLIFGFNRVQAKHELPSLTARLQEHGLNPGNVVTVGKPENVEDAHLFAKQVDVPSSPEDKKSPPPPDIGKDRFSMCRTIAESNGCLGLYGQILEALQRFPLIPEPTDSTMAFRKKGTRTLFCLYPELGSGDSGLAVGIWPVRLAKTCGIKVGGIHQFIRDFAQDGTFRWKKKGGLRVWFKDFDSFQRLLGLLRPEAKANGPSA
jgi:ribonuclease J